MQGLRTQASQSSHKSAPQISTASNTIDKAIDLTTTVAAIIKEVAEVLQHAPYVKTLSGIILQFIKIREELKTNKERCREIIDKVLGLSHWIYDKLAAIAKSGERAKENLAQVESSLNFCARRLSTLTNVLEELKNHQSRPRLVKFISRGLEDLNKLDRSVDNLEKRLVRDIVFEIKLQQGVPMWREHIEDPASHSTTSSGHDHVLPPKPYLMVEREAQVDKALKILLRLEPSRIAILGGGGFGKTTLARSLLHDPKIAERYMSRYFLSCEALVDADTVLAGIGNMLDIKASSSSILGFIRRKLEKSTTLLCLDNFETPWEPSATRTAVEDVLASIADIPKLSLIITARGTQRPSKVAWSLPLLPPLSTLSSESERIILQAICPDHIIDKHTQNLLDAVDGMPLAITLISNLLRDGETSRALWTRWSKEQTKIIENGGDDRESNLNASIALSVNSPRTKKDPGAITFLAALALLPDGFPLAAIEKLEEYFGINAIPKALQTLQAVALIKTNEAIPSSRIQMLSPIRLFCLGFLSSETSLALEKVVDFYISVMLWAEDSRDNAEIYARVVPEIPNLHSVFQRAYKAGYSKDINRFIDATTYLTSWSRYIGYLSQDTIKMALKSSTNHSILYAKCLLSLGILYTAEGEYPRAKTCFREAATRFMRGNNNLWEAHALYRCSGVLIYMGRLDKAEVTLKRSFKLYTQTDNMRGQADVRSRLGELYREKAQYLEAEATLTSALEVFKQIPDLIGLADTTENLSQLYLEHGTLVEAEKFATKSLNAARQAHYADGEGNALVLLGAIYLALDRVPDCRQVLEQALTINKQQNNFINQLNIINDLAQIYIQCDQLVAAEALLTASIQEKLDVVQIPIILTTLGWLYMCVDRLDRAEVLLDDALQRLQKFGAENWQAEVLARLGTLYLLSDRINQAERALKSISDLGVWPGIEIHRFWALGNLYTVKGEFDDAKASLDAAMARCQNAVDSFSNQQGYILRSMGTLHIKQGRVDRAIRAFKRAYEFHRKGQWVSEQANDLKRLGEAYEILERSEEANTAFKKAGELMESVRDARNLKE